MKFLEELPNRQKYNDGSGYMTKQILLNTNEKYPRTHLHQFMQLEKKSKC